MLHLSARSIFSLDGDGSRGPANISRSCGLLLPECVVVAAHSCPALSIATYFQCKISETAE